MNYDAPITVHYIGGPKDGEVRTHPYGELCALQGRINFYAPSPQISMLDRSSGTFQPLDLRDDDVVTYVLRGPPIMDDYSGDVYADYKGRPMR